jgi:hypothetical protein
LQAALSCKRLLIDLFVKYELEPPSITANTWRAMDVTYANSDHPTYRAGRERLDGMRMAGGA